MSLTKFYSQLLNSSEKFFTIDFVKSLSKNPNVNPSFFAKDQYKWLLKRELFFNAFLLNDLTHEEEMLIINPSGIDLGVRAKFVEDCFNEVETKYNEKSFELTVWGTSLTQERKVISFKGKFENDKLVKIIDNKLDSTRRYLSNDNSKEIEKSITYSCFSEMVNELIIHNLSGVISEVKQKEYLKIREKALKDILGDLRKELNKEPSNYSNGPRVGLLKNTSKNKKELLWKEGDFERFVRDRKNNLILKDYFLIPEDWERHLPKSKVIELKKIFPFSLELSNALKETFNFTYLEKIGSRSISEKAFGIKILIFSQILESIISFEKETFINLDKLNNYRGISQESLFSESISEIELLKKDVELISEKIHKKEVQAMIFGVIVVIVIAVFLYFAYS